MQDNDRRFADDMARLDADLGRLMASGMSDKEQDRFLGEDSVLLRGLLGAAAFNGDAQIR